VLVLSVWACAALCLSCVLQIIFWVLKEVNMLQLR